MWMGRLSLFAALLAASSCARAPSETTASQPTAPTEAPAPKASAPVESAPDASPVVEVQVSADAGKSAPSPVFTGIAEPRNPSDLAWLSELVRTLAERSVSREQVAAFLGKDARPDPDDSEKQLVVPHSKHLAKIEIYALSHVDIDVAVDIEFAEKSRPSRAAVERAIGQFKSMPRAPDDFSSGPKLSHYHKGRYKTARVFVELGKGDPKSVVSVHVDAE